MHRIIKFIPFLGWFPMPREALQANLLAGVTVALILIPQSMAYAQLAGLPAYFGLYAAFLPVAVAAMFGSSKQLATGPVAVVSLLTASALLPFAQMGTSEFVALAILLSLLVGTIQLSLGLFRLGVVVNFLSHPVIVGFTNAAAIIIALSQVSKVFGVKMGRSDNFAQDIWGVAQELGSIHWPTFAFAVVAFAIMFGMKKLRPKWPNVLAAVVVTTVASWAMDFAGMGGAVVGEIPKGLPEFAAPKLSLDMMIALLPSAFVISLVGFMEAISIAKAMAAKTRDRLDPNQELIGQGLANIVGCMSQAYPSSGSFSRSAVNLDSGATSGFSSVVTATMVLVTLLFLTPLLYHLPQAVLAAVIMLAVTGLVNFKSVIHAWQANRHDGFASVVTFIATLAFAPHLDKGILVGALLAIGMFLYRTMRPRVALLGRYEDGTLRDLEVHPNLPHDDRIIVVRFDGQLYFANVAFFEDTLLAAVADKPEARYVLVVGDGINALDASGEEVLHHLVKRFKSNNITLAFSGLKRQVLQVMRQTNLRTIIGGENLFATEDMALTAIYTRLGVEKGNRPLLGEVPGPAPAPAAEPAEEGAKEDAGQPSAQPAT